MWTDNCNVPKSHNRSVVFGFTKVRYRGLRKNHQWLCAAFALVKHDQIQSKSHPGAEEALYESPVLRRFAGVDLGRAAAPDETTILRFRHLLEQHDLCGKMLDTVNLYLDRKGIRITTGTIVDATIIAAPGSTKNSTGERDPAMHQTKKGKQWHFGAKAHIGVGSKEGIVHSGCTSAARVARIHMLADL